MRSPRKPSRKVADVLQQLAHTGDGVFAVDRQHRIILWNQAAESLLGYAAPEVLGKYCQDVVQGRDCAGALICCQQCAHFEQARKLQWTPHQDFRTRSKNGKELRINFSTLAVLSPRQELSTLVHIFRDADRAPKTPPRRKELPEAKLSSAPAPPARSRQLKGEGKPFRLTRRELAVLHHLAQAKGTKAIAEGLFISPTTVRNHVQRILKKLRIHSRLEAIAWAFHHRLL